MSDTREAWILTIGNEIINAVISDTNREAIARELRAIGIGVRGMSSVGDDPDR
ncbi:MAG: molybdopterin-binding protein, partial [Thermodesulfobacteriota bacterium]